MGGRGVPPLAYSVFFLSLSPCPGGRRGRWGKELGCNKHPPLPLKSDCCPQTFSSPPPTHSFPHRSGWEATVCNISSFLPLSLPSPTRSFSRLSPCGLGLRVTERLGVLGEDVDFFCSEINLITLFIFQYRPFFHPTKVLRVFLVCGTALHHHHRTAYHT